MRRVVDHVRGMDPWPAAWAARGDARLKLFGAGFSETPRPDGVAAGTVLGVGEAGLEVCCADGVVRVAQIQAPGKRRMAARDYAAGHPFAPGERLIGS